MKSVHCAFASGPARVGRIFAFRRTVAAFAVAGVSALVLSGCSDKSDSAASAAGGGQPAVEVGVFTVKEAPLTLTRELPGRTNAFRVAEVRARVDGIVGERLFEEGTDVKKGDVLYRIDPAPYQAELERAKASLARAEANIAASEAQVGRYKDLVARRAVSQQEYEDAVARLGVNRADLADAKAAVTRAEIDLGYTEVTAPIDGRIGRSEVTEGAYVQRANATLLATIRQLDPIYVDVTQSSDQVLRLKDDLAAGRLKRNADREEVAVTLLLPQGEYPQEGLLQFSEVNVNEGTSSVTLRALFPNKEDYLLPGMFVRARVPEAEQPDAILVPQRGVSRDNRGNAVALVVGAGGVVEQRTLELDRAVGNQWLVRSGLNNGDQLIVQGLQKVRPGVKVSAVQADAENKPAAGANSKLVETAEPAQAASAPAAGASAQSAPASAQQTAAR